MPEKMPKGQAIIRKRQKAKQVAPILPAGVLDPNPNDLAREWQRQPKLFYNVAKETAKARKEKDRLYAAHKIAQAEAYKAIRKKPGKFTLPERPTEAMVNYQVLLQQTVIDAHNNFLNAQEKYDVLSATCEALQQRCKTLEYLVRLHGMNYYSEPHVGDSVDQNTIDNLKKQSARKTLRKRRRSNG